MGMDIESFAAAARAEASRGAAAHQLAAVKQRGERSLIRIAQLPADNVEEARQKGHGTLLALVDGVNHDPGALDNEAAKASRTPLTPARANQMAAVKQRGEGSILRLGKLTPDEVDDARKQ